MTGRRMLVAGASGLVGAHVARAASIGGWEVTGAARKVEGLATIVLDLTDRAAVRAALGELRPDVVVIASAFAWVDGCERDPARSHAENVATVANVAEAAARETQIVFYSTDHVFDGAKASYVEDDAVSPPSVYARHKREAEELLLRRGRSLVARTSYVFGRERRRKNFMYRVLDAVAAHQALVVPERQAGTPTWAGWLAASTLTLLEREASGLVHLVGRECLTKAEWAKLLARGLGLGELEVVETSWEEAGQVAPRPARVVLESARDLGTPVHPPLTSLLEAERRSLLEPAE